MLLRIPAQILIGIIVILLLLITMAVIGWGFFRKAEEKMAEDVVPEKEVDKRSPESELNEKADKKKDKG